MTEQPRLTDAARAAIEAAVIGAAGQPGRTGGAQITKCSAATGEVFTDLPSLGDTRMTDEYRRGWNDCRDFILKMLKDPR